MIAGYKDQPGRYCYHILADIAIISRQILLSYPGRYFYHVDFRQYYTPSTGRHLSGPGMVEYTIEYYTMLLQECGVGSKCRTLAGVNTCTSCPQNTVCIQQTTDSDFFCQYSFCLPQSMICGVSTAHNTVQDRVMILDTVQITVVL